MLSFLFDAEYDDAADSHIIPEILSAHVCGTSLLPDFNSVPRPDPGVIFYSAVITVVIPCLTFHCILDPPILAPVTALGFFISFSSNYLI